MGSNEESTSAPDAGVSPETHGQVREELAKLREQLAISKAKNEAYDSLKRDALCSMKPEVNAFIETIVNDEVNAPYRHELAPMSRWAGDIEKTDALETNLSIGRLISCASARFKRTREEASTASEKSQLLASCMKELDEVKAERDSLKSAKAQRESELLTLVDERTTAATKLQEELAKHGLVQEKIDFSQRAARENVGGGAAAASASAPSKTSRGAAPTINMDDALLSFVRSSASSGGRMITPSSTDHHYVGQVQGSARDMAVAAASGLL